MEHQCSGDKNRHGRCSRALIALSGAHASLSLQIHGTTYLSVELAPSLYVNTAVR